jgi:SAM-dependent methyltransferase
MESSVDWSQPADNPATIAERAAAQGDFKGMYAALSALPFADFCEILTNSSKRYPNLTQYMPSMPADEIQKRWTGHFGRELLVKSCNTVRLFQIMSYTCRRRAISGPILDYGCGWGRLTRLAAYFCDPDQLYGVDPMRESLAECATHNVRANFALIEPIPETFPFDSVRFDFAFGFSVMTHTPVEVTEAILRCVRTVISDDGLFICTIRPKEFWQLRRAVFGDKKVDELLLAHERIGYAYQAVGGGVELTKDKYGDTSYSFSYFSELAEQSGWRMLTVDRDVLEPFQFMVALGPK